MEQPLENVSAVILAGGKGTRMRSRLPKVLHPVLGEPMIYHALRAVEQSGIPPERTLVVIGHGAEQVREKLAGRGPYLFAEQAEQLGTGHALKMAGPVLQDLARRQPGTAAHLLVIYGDNALLRPQTLLNLITRHLQSNPHITLATSEIEDPTGYGRIVRDPVHSHFKAIVEQADLTSAQQFIKEFNAGMYVFKTDWLWEALPRLQQSAKGEYYLTDLAAFAVQSRPRGKGVETLRVESEEVLGINDRLQLAEVANILRQRVLRDLMLSGVTITDPATTYISAETTIEPDTIIEPNTHLRGRCQIGTGCVIGPNSLVIDAQINNDCVILASVIENSVLEQAVQVGPFSRVRPGCHLESGVHMGNFAEVSRSHIGANTRQGHFSFIGDATLGPDVNIGAGTITANYDGVNKHRTVIGAHAFIGSDTILRAPLTLGDEARTGAGSVVTRDVEAGVTVVGLPARPIRRKAGSQTNGSHSQ